MLLDYRNVLAEVSENIKLQYYVEDHYLSCRLTSDREARGQNQGEFLPESRDLRGPRHRSDLRVHPPGGEQARSNQDHRHRTLIRILISYSRRRIRSLCEF